MSRRTDGPDQAARPFGRPPRASVRYHLRLPLAVSAALETDAREAGYPSAVAFLRELAAVRRPPYAINHRVYSELLRQLVRLGTNLNQLARAVNAGRAPYVSPAALDEALGLLGRIQAFLVSPR